MSNISMDINNIFKGYMRMIRPKVMLNHKRNIRDKIFNVTLLFISSFMKVPF